MQLVAIWVKDHILLGTSIFNFGGKHFYSYKLEDKKVSFERRVNENYIPDFYSDLNSNLSLVSAVVGKNGTGKSTLLNLVRDAFIEREKWGGYIFYSYAILFLEESNGDKIHVKESIPFPREKFSFKFKFRLSADLFVMDIPRIETVYYSPFLDTKLGIHHDIDISLDRLIRTDISSNESKETNSPVQEHKLQNIYRQFHFLGSQLAQQLYREFDIPYYDKASLYFRGPSFSPDDKYFHNTSYEFRSFITKIYEKWQEEIYKTERQVNSKTEIEEDRKIVKLWFLREMFFSLFRPLEAKNTYLDEGRVKIELDDMNDLSFKEALIAFLDNHHFIKFTKTELPKEQAKKLIETTFNIIDTLEKDSFVGTQKILLDFSNTKKILDAHRDFLNGFLVFTDNPVGFIDIGPEIELSSGEKALLDLFSRFYFAIDEINDRKRQRVIHSYENNFPNHFLLLLDEGDLGFHPVWKKKYVKNLVEILPKFFEVFDEAVVQIIFTTHDPLTLSDIPNYNIAYLNKSNGRLESLNLDDSRRPNQSFGANISTLLSDSFFVDDGLVGEFAIQRIDATIEWLNSKEPYSSEEEDYHLKLIEIIDEPLIKTKLSEMFAEKTGKNHLEIKVIEEQIKLLAERKEKLRQKP